MGRSPWWGLSFALVPGVVVGVAFATAEPLALALAALGLSLLAAVLAIVAFQGTPREPPGSVKAGLPSCRDDDPCR